MPKMYKYLIVGGGIAGTTAAGVIRQNDKDGNIAILSDEPHRLYSRIMLSKPNFFLEKIPFEQIWLKEQEWYEEHAIDLITGKSATGLDVNKKIVVLDDGQELKYEKLLLATGGHVRKWDVSGSDKAGIHYVRTLDDAKGLIENAKTSKHGVAVGGGFISFEMCEMMRLANLDVAIVLREPRYWAGLLDETSSKMIEEAMTRSGVKIFKEAEVAEVRGGTDAEAVVLKDGTKLPAEMIVAGIGLIFLCDWFSEAGIEVDRGIITNEYLETNVPDVWAAGDIAQFTDIVLKERVMLGNWANAQMQGKVAGENMTGKHGTFEMVSFYTAEAFGLRIAMVGNVRLDESRDVVVRRSEDGNAYGRLITKDSCVVGATLINMTQDIGAISKLIQQRIDISNKSAQLSDPAFNLSELLK